MNNDGSAIVRRARYFLSELRAGKFPNATSIQVFDKCSKSTATRAIDRLRDEYGFPIKFDASERGYYLTDPAFNFEFLPPGKDEYCALFLMRELASTIDCREIRDAIESLWRSALSQTGVIQHEIRALESRFSADVTAVSVLADAGVLQLVSAAATGEHVLIRYKSPWRNPEPREFRGMIERVHLSDSTVYVLFRSEKGRLFVLNAAFVKELNVLREPVAMGPLEKNEDSLGWLDGFGVWTNEPLRDVMIRIVPPAAEYYASQRWHPEQVDTWEGEVLCRTFPSMISPEIVRRIMSVGRFVSHVEPSELAAKVREEARALYDNIAAPGE